MKKSKLKTGSEVFNLLFYFQLIGFVATNDGRSIYPNRTFGFGFVLRGRRRRFLPFADVKFVQVVRRETDGLPYGIQGWCGCGFMRSREDFCRFFSKKSPKPLDIPCRM